jgi:hypothetical protein
MLSPVVVGADALRQERHAYLGINLQGKIASQVSFHLFTANSPTSNLAAGLLILVRRLLLGLGLLPFGSSCPSCFMDKILPFLSFARHVVRLFSLNSFCHHNLLSLYKYCHTQWFPQQTGDARLSLAFWLGVPVFIRS